MLRVPRLHGVVIKTMGELAIGDIVILPPAEWQENDDARTIKVRSVSLIGDDIEINDEMISSVGNCVVVVDKGNR